MEQKTNPGQQAEPKKKEPTAWLQEVSELTSAIGEQLNEKTGNGRGFIVVAVDRANAETDDDGQAIIGLARSSIALATAMRLILTAKPFAPHIAHAAQMMAKEAAAKGGGTIVIHAGDFDEDEDDQAGDDNQEQEQSQEGEADGE